MGSDNDIGRGHGSSLAGNINPPLTGDGLRADLDALKWARDRLEYVHKDNPNVDFMHRIRAALNNLDVAVQEHGLMKDELERLRIENEEIKADKLGMKGYIEGLKAAERQRSSDIENGKGPLTARHFDMVMQFLNCKIKIWPAMPEAMKDWMIVEGKDVKSLIAAISREYARGFTTDDPTGAIYPEVELTQDELTLEAAAYAAKKGDIEFLKGYMRGEPDAVAEIKAHVRDAQTELRMEQWYNEIERNKKVRTRSGNSIVSTCNTSMVATRTRPAAKSPATSSIGSS